MLEMDYAKEWINGYEHSPAGPGPGPAWDPEEEIRSSLLSLENAINSTTKQLVSEAELILIDISKAIQSSTLTQFKELCVQLTCDYNSDSDLQSKLKKLFNSEGVQNIFDVEGTEDIQMEKFGQLVEITKYVVSNTIYDLITKNFILKMSDLLQHLKPDDPNHVVTMLYKSYTGKIPRLEHLFLRILEGVQTDEFFEKLDSVFKDFCATKKNYSLLLNTIEHLKKSFHFVAKYVGKNKKLDMLKLLTELKNSFPDIFKDTAEKINHRIDDLFMFAMEGKLSWQLNYKSLSLVLPDCAEKAECGEILLEEYWWGRYKVCGLLLYLHDFIESIRNVDIASVYI